MVGNLLELIGGNHELSHIDMLRERFQDKKFK